MDDIALQNVVLEATKPKRYALFDTLRGLLLLSMILYHTVWDLVNLYQVSLPWYQSEGALFWQQSICWGFILLSGFCWSLGSRSLKRGLQVSAAGLVVTLSTILIMPENRIVFGILTFLGSAMLLLIPLEKLLQRVPPVLGLICSMVLFLMLLNLKAGSIGLGNWKLTKLPQKMYHGYIATYFGFLDAGFYSSDYFPLFPWLFLFIAGYFLYHLAERRGMKHRLYQVRLRPFDTLGKHTLLLYLIHQPVIYLILAVAVGQMP